MRLAKVAGRKKRGHRPTSASRVVATACRMEFAHKKGNMIYE
jgi:hypothetical protein